MSDFYNRMAAVAERLVTDKGRKVTFIKNSATPLDANKPWGQRTGPTSSVVLDCAFVPPGAVRQFGLTALGEGTEFRDLISFSEQIGIVFPKTVDIRSFTHVLDYDGRYGIVGTQLLRPGDIQILAFVGIRR